MMRVLVEDGRFGALLAALRSSAVALELGAAGGAGSWTLFAAPDEAFAALPPDTRAALAQPEQKGVLERVLRHHILPSSLLAQCPGSGSVRRHPIDREVAVSRRAGPGPAPPEHASGDGAPHPPRPGIQNPPRCQ